MAGRRSIIGDDVILLDPETGKEETLPLTQALCRLLELGCYVTYAAESLGISKAVVYKWLARGREWTDADGEVPEAERPYVEFVDSVTRATARGIAWHEANVTRGAREDPRLSIEYLQRRAPREYAKRVEIDTNPQDRETPPLDPISRGELEEAFDAANIPDGIDPASLLAADRDEPAQTE